MGVSKGSIEFDGKMIEYASWADQGNKFYVNVADFVPPHRRNAFKKTLCEKHSFEIERINYECQTA